MSSLNLMLRRREMMKVQGGTLPSGYTQKNMLISNGEFVSLQISLKYFTIVTSLVWDAVSRQSLIGNGQSFFGINTTSGWRTNNTLQTQSFENMGVANTKDLYNVIYKRGVGLTSLTVNGEEGGVSTTAPSSATLYLFNINNNYTYRCYAKMGETLIYDQDDVLVSRLIPCVDDNNQSGMYDVVRKMFFTNSAFTTE